MSRTEVSGVACKVNLSKALGQLEVIDPDGRSHESKYLDCTSKNTCEIYFYTDEDYTKTSISGSLKFTSQSTEFAAKRPESLQNGKLQVLGPKEELVIHPCGSASRPGSAAGRQGSAGRKSYIPTRQIPLCSVKPSAPSNIPDYSVAPIVQTNTSEEDEKGTTGPQSLAIHSDNFKGRLEESSEEDESDDDASRAPIELLAEFISAVMGEDYQVAQKLCRMILLYEPNNPEAVQFSPLIEEMLKIEQEESSDDEDSEDSDEETDEETDEEDPSDTDDDDEDDEENHFTAKHLS
ncbi:glutamate-rich protein 2 isoform X2 [Ranitomeya variabilis]|uniref:glutamate-rich protein 2 isoform X2 n=1 Tax=Ranitomeya variabilis TaxID=490064 RepID=UPI004056688C